MHLKQHILYISVSLGIIPYTICTYWVNFISTILDSKKKNIWLDLSFTMRGVFWVTIIEPTM